MGFGVTAPTIVDNIKKWLPSYELNADGRFIEKEEKKPPVKEIVPSPPASKQSKIWYRSQNPLVGKSALRQHNGIMSARRTVRFSANLR